MTRRAFSLLELLVAIALILALLGALFAFFWDVLATRGQIVGATARQRAATMFVEAVERDLMHCVVGGERAGAGVKGDATSLSVLTRLVPAGRAGRSDSGSALADLERAEYVFAGGGLTVTRGVPGGDRAEPERLGGSIAKVRLRFHDGVAWRDEFDSLAAEALPRAVEVAIWFRSWPGDAPADEQREDEEAVLERSTFDPTAGFDEREAALLRDVASAEEPRPDRVRVIAVPDAAAEVGS